MFLHAGLLLGGKKRVASECRDPTIMLQWIESSQKIVHCFRVRNKRLKRYRIRNCIFFPRSLIQRLLLNIIVPMSNTSKLCGFSSDKRKMRLFPLSDSRILPWWVQWEGQAARYFPLPWWCRTLKWVVSNVSQNKTL
jgi:hypothetical protein